MRERTLRRGKELFYDLECETSCLFCGHNWVEAVRDEVKCILLNLGAGVEDHEAFENFESNLAEVSFNVSEHFANLVLRQVPFGYNPYQLGKVRCYGKVVL